MLLLGADFIIATVVRTHRSVGIGILGFALALGAQASATSEDEVTRLNNLGVQAHARGGYAEAVHLLRQALASAEAKLASDDPVVATTLSNLAESEIALGSLAEAEAHLTRAVEITHHNFGQSDPRTAKRLSILGYLLTRKGHHTEAERVYRQALTVREAHPGDRSVDLMTTLNNLADCLVLQRRFGPALALVRRALMLGESNWGIDHPQLAPVLNTLAGIYGAQRKWDDAQATLERARAIHEHSPGASRPVLGGVLNNLGAVALQRDRYAEADRRFREALQIYEEAYGLEHVEIGKSLNNLAESLRSQNRYSEAEPHFRRALAICDRLLSGDHPQTMQTLVNYARLLRQTGRKDEASRMEKRAAQAVASRKKADPSIGLTVDYRDLARSRPSASARGAKLHVALYDLASLSPPILAAAQREAAGVFAAAGIEIIWMRDAPSAPEAHESDFSGPAPDEGSCQGRSRSRVRLRIVEKSPPGWNKYALGLALPCAKFGIDATIFRDRIENVAQNATPFVAKILGHAMAHELGHVLLRSNEHSTRGVMKARYSQSDLHDLTTALLPFTPEEAETIRQEVIRDSRAP